MKQFTAMAILLLEQQGKLSLDDDVRKHIPELPDLGQVVTLKNMLNHTNGFREVYNLIPMTGWKGEDKLLREEVLETLKRQKELQAAPGEVYNYNNSAFIMLAEIVERISGQTFPEFMEENVFGPLGMSSSVVRANPSVIVPGASQGYTSDSTGFHETGDLYAAYGAGGIYTTVEDASKWMGNFSDPVLGGEELVTRLVTPDTLNSGDTMSYALGIMVGEHKGLVRYSHSGADLAHRAVFVYFPEIDAGVVAMSNNAGFPAGSVAYILADAFLSDEIEKEEDEEEQEEVKDSTSVEVAQRVMEMYAGDYMIKGVGYVLSFSFKDGMLKLTTEGQPESEMQAQSQTRFKYEGVDALIEFHLDDQGKVTGAVHSQGGQDYELELVAPYDPSLEVLQTYTGKYLSVELETFYTLELRDSSLVILIRNSPEIELDPVKPDHFKGDVFFLTEVLFERNELGEVSGFTASNDRTHGIVFAKQ